MHTTAHDQKPNRLIGQKSPYLLQHAFNPVDWYAWGADAFQKAKHENKPIFLSIGYSSCHWCHVMAHESFEDPEIAKFLNENFVSVKVDREERPDVDEIYMKAVMSMTGSGGWPLSVFLTPSLEPFFGGTYFPPTPRSGMPSFINLLKGISGSWKSERKNVVESAAHLKNALLVNYDFKKTEGATLDLSLVEECYSNLAGMFDERYGGFGGPPKFPMPSNIFFLMRYWKRKSSKLALNMVTKTLDSILAGGIYDHVGGGFHRYSTDRYWLVPHFEKMLYDNAQLIIAYAEAFLVTGNANYARVVKDTIAWAKRELRSVEGGFYSSQDADSPEGEGFYYLWTPDDLRNSLKDKIQNPEVVASFFSVTSEGNFEHSKTILTRKPFHEVMMKFGLDEKQLAEILSKAGQLMLSYRNNRNKPSTDTKIITSWNGLMISALSRAYCVFNEEEYLELAITAADYILRDTSEVSKIMRIHKGGEANIAGLLEDYAFFINGLVDLYEASFDPKYIIKAIGLCDSMIEEFHDSNGGFFVSHADKDLIVRAKDSYDGAIPSGNSMAALVLARLSEFTGRDDLRDLVRETFEIFSGIMSNQPSSFSQMLAALQFYLGEPKEIVISGILDSNDTKELLSVVRSQFLPNSGIVLADSRLEGICPLVQGRLPLKGVTTRVFVCTNFSCKLPSETKEDLLKSLTE